jgi:high mobility group protein B2
MASEDQIKNIVERLSSVLGDLLTNVFTGKTASKAVSAITDEKAQEILTEFVKNNMKVKAIKKTDKKKKDPDAPKKNCSSYIFFCKDTRDTVKEDNPEFKGTEVTKELGRLWRELDEEGKAPFVEKAEADKVRYTKEMEGYTPSEGFSAGESEGKGKKGKAKKARKPGPKRASSSYLFFCKEQRSKVKDSYPDMDAKDVTRELGRMWKEDMTPKKKKKFENLAAEDKARYESEKESWVDPKAEQSDSDNGSEENDKTVEKKTKKNKSSDDDKSDKSDGESDVEPPQPKKTKKKTQTDDETESDTEKPKKTKKKTQTDDETESDTEKPKKTKKTNKPPRREIHGAQASFKQ